ncbi:helix-turn-helix domain-containing protein [Streptomyces noursei]|uniref:helix-turn-helix domain-containing protein n=1 Tax=Streptomyces noursei TaxID=1971 RepID=UPI00099F6A33|nr:helix-turn-helix domain-containing protein [Streptomyces noursei]
MRYYDWGSPNRAERLNELLKAARKRAGLTQSKAAYLKNCHDSYLQRVEKGKDRPSIAFLVELIDIYGIDDGEELHEIWWLARGHAPPGNVDPLAGMRVDSHYRDLVLQDTECMAYLADGAYNVLACNPLWAENFEGEPPTNMLRWMMLDDRARGGPEVKNPVLMNWESQWAPYFVTRLERVISMSGGRNLELNGLLKEMRADPRAVHAYSSYAGTQIHSDGAFRPFFHSKQGAGFVRLFPVEVVGSTATIMRLKFTKTRPSHQVLLTSAGEVLEEIT